MNIDDNIIAILVPVKTNIYCYIVTKNGKVYESYDLDCVNTFREKLYYKQSDIYWNTYYREDIFNYVEDYIIEDLIPYSNSGNTKTHHQGIFDTTTEKLLDTTNKKLNIISLYSFKYKVTKDYTKQNFKLIDEL